jgi:hypothetical protein
MTAYFVGESDQGEGEKKAAAWEEGAGEERRRGQMQSKPVSEPTLLPETRMKNASRNE